MINIYSALIAAKKFSIVMQPLSAWDLVLPVRIPIWFQELNKYIIDAANNLKGKVIAVPRISLPTAERHYE